MPKNYRPRIIDEILAEYVKELPAICLDGAKGVGKTSTARRISASEFRFDEEVSRELIHSAPELLQSAAKPVLLDEWQRLPETWDKIRRFVDEDNTVSQYILTGSAASEDESLHSGAERIVRLRMRPLSLAERELEKATVSVKDLLNDQNLKVFGESGLSLIDYVDEIILSGFPAINTLSDKAARLQLESYIDNIVDRAFVQAGHVVKRPATLRYWLRSYAAATGTTTSYSSLLDAATPGEADKPSKETTRAYRDTLTRLWLIDDVEPWLPLHTKYKYLGKTAKHYLVDPALAACLMDVSKDNLVQSSKAEDMSKHSKTFLGRLFESLIALSLQTYALANNARLRHFRGSNGAREVDFIIEKGMSIIAIEVKLSNTVDTKEARTLNWFAEEFSGYNIAKCIINTGSHAYTRNDGIHVIPAALL